jgi:transmembrane sensor
MNAHDPLEQAAGWLALISSGEATTQQHQDYERWCRQYPREAAAISRLSGQLRGLQDQGLGGLSSRQLVGVVNTPTTRRKVLRATGGGLGLGLLAMLAGPGALRALQPGERWSTDTGERRQLMLSDGSELTLDACSAVRALQVRCLALEQGQISLRIVQGPAFRIDTAHGSLLSPQARLVLRREAHTSRVTVLEGSAWLLSEGREHRLDAGQRASFDASGLIAIEHGGSADDAWTRGLLRVENQSLSQVIRALQDYRHGVIQLDERVAHRRVSGVYPLDDSDRSLALLSDSLGLRLRFFSRYWVSISAA